MDGYHSNWKDIPMKTSLGTMKATTYFLVQILPMAISPNFQKASHENKI